MRQDSDGRFWLIFLFFGAKESPGRKLEDKRQLEGEKKEKKYITTREKKRKERKGRGRDVAMALVLRLLHARERELLSSPFSSSQERRKARL